MKTLVDIDEDLLREAMSVAAAATKKETVVSSWRSSSGLGAEAS